MIRQIGFLPFQYTILLTRYVILGILKSNSNLVNFQNMKYKHLIILIFCVITQSWAQDKGIRKGQNGQVAFVSEAPLELIQANSENLSGVVNTLTNRFAFQVDIHSFEGFNSQLQRIHFQENYLESSEFPYAVFEGTILDDNIFGVKGSHSIRAKGIFNLHGIDQERIIRGTVEVHEDHVVILAKFNVRLEEHNIRVPRIVYQKIAEEIDVSLRIELR